MFLSLKIRCNLWISAVDTNSRSWTTEQRELHICRHTDGVVGSVSQYCSMPGEQSLSLCLEYFPRTAAGLLAPWTVGVISTAGPDPLCDVYRGPQMPALISTFCTQL